MLNVGVIGLGVGEQHIYGFQKSKYADPILICDFDEKKLTDVAIRSGIKNSTTDAEQILTDPNIDIVSIASFDQFHAEQVIAALRNGKHVFVEKPLCLTRSELDDISKEYAQTKKLGLNLHLSSNFILRREERFIKLKKRILDGGLGEIYSVEGSYDYGRLKKLTGGWRSSVRNYSIVNGGGIHILDLLQWLTEEKFSVISAISNKASTLDTAFKPDDNVIAIGNFGKKIIGKISTNFGSQTPHFHQIKIYGTKGTFVHDCGVGNYYFGSEPNEKKEIDKTSFPTSTKGDFIPNFVEAIFFEKKQEIDFETVHDVMHTSLEINEKIIAK